MQDLLRALYPSLSPAVLVSTTVARLLLAAFLGGLIGFEREVKQKPAGLRTNMFICFGAAMFTILSHQLAGEFSGDHTRIAAQIIPGIGFIGAGSILHSRGSVTGLTTAATLFVVASVGMAVGGGRYLVGIFATVVILLALHVLGWLEARFDLKTLLMDYEVLGESADAIVGEVNTVLGEEHQRMESVQMERMAGGFRIRFGVAAAMSEHGQLLKRFRESDLLRRIECTRCPETE